MTPPKDGYGTTKRLFTFSQYLVFFILTASIVSCSLLVFLSSVNIPKAVILEGAPITFLSVVVISVFYTIIDAIRRKYTVEKPLFRIIEGTRRVTRGDFKTRIEPFRPSLGKNEFNLIIERLNIMIAELSSIETLKTDFITNVSHEFKTPLSIIGNYAALLQSKDLSTEKREEYAANLAGATNRLSELITDILRLNKLENQQIYPENKIFNLSEQLCECLLGFEEIWEQRHIGIKTHIDENVTISSSRELLSLVWNNLISNALKFTEAGGYVSLSLKKMDNSIEVTVSDTGCGISRENGERIFDKFYQGDTSRASSGNGLGLALVKRVIDILGYEIRVDSEISKGSTFAIVIPLAQPPMNKG